MTCAAEDLLAEFLQLTDPSQTDDDPQRPRWLRVWSLFAEHAWFQDQLRWCAQSALRNHANRQLADDVCQDVACGLARKFQWRADLNFDRTSSAEEFGRWLRTILIRDCRLAIERQAAAPCAPMPAEPPSAPQPNPVDLWDSVEILEAADRSIVALYLHGYSYREIEEELNRPYWTVRRIVHRWGRQHFAESADDHSSS